MEGRGADNLVIERDSLVDAGKDIDNQVVRELWIHILELGKSTRDHAQRLDLSSVHVVVYRLGIRSHYQLVCIDWIQRPRLTLTQIGSMISSTIDWPALMDSLSALL